MKAIFVTGGKQYYVTVGDAIYVEKLNVESTKPYHLSNKKLTIAFQIFKNIFLS